jgi:hypothetical protein
LEEIAMSQIKLLITIIAYSLLSLLGACGGGGSSGGGNTNPAVPPPTNTASGTVTFNGAPLAGVTVIAFNTNHNPSTIFATATTDSGGNYSFSNLGTACTACGYITNYQFVASKPGYSFNPLMAANPSGNRSGYLWFAPAQDWYVNTGAAVTRQGYNASFTNQNGGAGIMFNVINLNSVVNNSITGANFSAYDGSNQLVSLAATGQMTSYVSGDDASMKKGVALPSVRFVDNQNGTVTDNLTGLVWLKNAGCITPTLWANAVADANQLANGACGLTDGSKAGDWRLPNIVELESVIDVSASNPALTAGNPFTNVSNSIYWSSTPYFGGAEGTTNAWVIRMSDGRYINDDASSNLNVMASSNNAVWAVKGSGGRAIKLQATGAYVPFASSDDGSIESGVPLPAPRMRDNGNGTVTDTVTGLIWLKQADCINQPWAGAIAAVNNLASGQCGLTDASTAGQWRMPNRKEMESLADRAQNNMALYFDETFVSGTVGVSSQSAIFTNFNELQYYWTSTTDASNISEAWTVFSCDFGVYDIPKTNTGYSLAVR